MDRKKVIDSIKYVHIEAYNIVYPDECFSSNYYDDKGEMQLPYLKNESWGITIGINNGVVLDWPKEIYASINFKVRDECFVKFLNKSYGEVARYEGYVPGFLELDENGYGDYMNFTIQENGVIKNWKYYDIINFLCEMPDKNFNKEVIDKLPTPEFNVNDIVKYFGNLFLVTQVDKNGGNTLYRCVQLDNPKERLWLGGNVLEKVARLWLDILSE